MDLSNPLVQAYLFVNEREVEVKLLPKMKYTDLEGTIRELAGYEGCRHVILNFGLANGTWERLEAIVCDAEVKSSTKPLSQFRVEGEVERIVAEVYEFERDLLGKLEQASSIQPPEEVEELAAIEQPPILKITQMSSKMYPTDLLPEPGSQEPITALKDASRILIVALEANSIEDYALATVADEEGRKHVLLTISPTHIQAFENDLLSTIREQLKEYGIEDIYVIQDGKIRKIIKL
ncbi:hypothetical protein EYM_02450 [Ignicoccus islandicus DSM 13165]|uniref:Uncharacterized protein n=1 Tax=Ignicoccus islandicus DSM 13165 TaxID=940295 RepID=A0A0U3F448_9CREN|nr:hypothetical protein EYM_02450 [Ignicoccus islandicus DSM 13165]